jgi:choline/glycine/proline betaine transport protein
MPGTPEEFQYGLRLRRYEMPSYSYMDRDTPDEPFFRAEVFLETGGQDYDVLGFTRDELMQDVLQQYDRHFQFLHAVRTV